MAHFAEIDANGIVLRVIVAEQDFIDSGKVGDPSMWVQTSDSVQTLRKNYAGTGYTYDKGRDAFIPPKPFSSFVLNEEKARYEAPVEMPKDGKPYEWDEKTTAWVEAKAIEATESLEVNPL